MEDHKLFNLALCLSVCLSVSRVLRIIRVIRIMRVIRVIRIILDIRVIRVSVPPWGNPQAPHRPSHARNAHLRPHHKTGS